MGAYLTQPNVEKESWERSSGRLSFGVSAMQGWRVAMEDAHSCLPDLDSETALFAVYDGHGGAEVAQYCAKYLPDVIKEQAAYRDGKLHKALKDAFLALDARLTDAAVIRELKAMAVHDTGKGGTEMADEDDVDNEEAALLHEEATMTMEELLRRYGQGGSAARARKGIPPKPEHDGLNGEGSSCPGEAGKEAPSDGKPHGAAAGGNGVPEKSAPEPAGAADASPGSSAGRSESSGGGGSTAASTDDQSGTSAAPPAAPSSSAATKKGAGAAARSARSATKPVFFEDSDDDSDADKASSDEDEDSEDESCSEEEEESEEEESEEESEDEEDPDDEDVGIPGMEIREEPGCDSGTTAVVALLRGSQLVVANAGDSRCVVSGAGGKAVEMSCDHKPEDQAELERICAAGGKVTMDGRVNGGLNLSRAIGDHFYKQNALLPPEKQMISALPDVRSLTLTEEHEFMVIACDGIWNVLSSQEVVDFVSERLHRRDAQGNLLTLSAITDELLDQCLAPDNTGDGTGCDNMTCLIVTFTLRPGCPAASAATPASPLQESNKHKLESSVDGEEEGERVSDGEVRQKEKRARTEA